MPLEFKFCAEKNNETRFVSSELFFWHTGLWKVWIFLTKSSLPLTPNDLGWVVLDSSLSVLRLMACFDLSSK